MPPGIGYKRRPIDPRLAEILAQMGSPQGDITPVFSSGPRTDQGVFPGAEAAFGKFLARSPQGMLDTTAEDLSTMGSIAGTVGDQGAAFRAGQAVRKQIAPAIEGISELGIGGTAKAVGGGVAKAIDERGLGGIMSLLDVPTGGLGAAALGGMGLVGDIGKATRGLKAAGNVGELAGDIKARLQLDALDVFETKGGDIQLSMIAVPKAARSKGVGSEALQELVDFADANGKRITLTTGSKDPHLGTTSAARLKKFYKRFGFVENKGRNKDFTTMDNMLRDPKAAAKVDASIAAEKERLLRRAASGNDTKAYHGTTHDFQEFTLKNTTADNHLGRAHYFTTSPEDAGVNYGGVGPDLTIRIEREAELMDEMGVDALLEVVSPQHAADFNRQKAELVSTLDATNVRHDQIMDAGGNLDEINGERKKLHDAINSLDSKLLFQAAKDKMTGHEGAVMPMQLKAERPLHLDDDSEIFEIVSNFDDEDEFIDEVGNGLELIDAMRRAADNFDGIDGDEVVEKFMEFGGDEMVDGITAPRVDSILREIDPVAYAESFDDGGLMGNEYIRQVYEEMGYGSVIMDPKKAFPNMPDIPDGTRHIIIFDKFANNIRSPNAAFDPKRADSRNILATAFPIVGGASLVASQKGNE